MGIFDFLKQKPRPSSFELADLIEIIQDGICITRNNGDLIYANPAAYTLLEIPRDNVLESFNFFQSFVKEETTIQTINRSLQTDGMLKNLEIVLHTRSDVKKDIILNANVLGDFTQEEYAILFLFKDITEIKLIQQQLLQSQKLESVGLMASGIAHDFNNILAAIIPNAELIKLSSPIESENYKRALIIEKSAVRATEIANKLLTFTRGQEQQKEWIDLNAIIENTVELLKSTLPSEVQVDLDLADDLSIVHADPTQMEQVLINLILNAKDAMPDGGTIFISTSNETIEERFQHTHLSPGNYVQLIVKDTGTGIPPEVISKIFDPFFTTKEIGKGTGLGLSMVYGIVQNHKGHVFVDSQVDKGTQFSIYLPATGKRTQSTHDHSMPERSHQKGKTILIVDDEKNVREVLGDILEFLGHEVILADSGQAALKIYDENHTRIDYIILDLRMPKMDGRMTLQKLKLKNPQVKVIATSGFDANSRQTYEEMGIVGFLKKPYNITRVSRMLEEIFENEQGTKWNPGSQKPAFLRSYGFYLFQRYW